MSGTPEESSLLSQHDAVEMLLNVNTAPEEASPDVEEQTAETTDEVEATEVEYEEVEAVESDQAEMEADEAEDDGEVLETEEFEELIPVKVDGKEGEVTKQELIATYQKTKTADKRLQEVSEERKAFNAEKAAFEQERAQLQSALAATKDFLKRSDGQKDQAYWDNLYESDPLDYVRQRENERDNQQKLQAVEQEQLRLEQQKRQEEAKKVFDLIPEWKDAEVARREVQQLSEYSQTNGFTSEEVGYLGLDSRLMHLIRKAMMYDSIKGQAPAAVKKVRKAPKMVKSSQPKPAKSPSESRKQKAFDNLKRSGTRDAAVEYLLSK